MKFTTRITDSIVATIETDSDAVTENQIANVVDRAVKLSDAEARQWAYRLCNYGDNSSWFLEAQEAIQRQLGVDAEVTFSYSPEEA